VNVHARGSQRSLCLERKSKILYLLAVSQTTFALFCHTPRSVTGLLLGLRFAALRNQTGNPSWKLRDYRFPARFNFVISPHISATFETAAHFTSAIHY